MVRSGNLAGLGAGVRNHKAFLMVLGLAILAGIFLFRDFGNSWDEELNATVGLHALRTYSGGTLYYSDSSIGDHGPVYFMLFASAGRLIHQMVPEWAASDGRHLTNYATFLTGLVFLYMLSLRFLDPERAWLVPALFVAQPVVFGYAFVNQKDIPFMTFFLASVTLGMLASDRPSESAGAQEETILKTPRDRATRFFHNLGKEIAGFRPSDHLIVLLITGLLLLAAIDLTVTGFAYRWAGASLAAAYEGKASWLVQWLYSHVATDAYKTPLALYVAKLDQAFSLMRQGLGPMLLLATAIVPGLLLPRSSRSWGFDSAIVRNWPLWATSLALGITISIRQVGIFALGLVGLYMLLKLRARALFPAFICTYLAAAITVLTWPYLWGDPWNKFWADMMHVINFPSHTTLFMGKVYASTQLPWTFFPVMAGIELTIPAAGLIVAGIILLGFRFLRHLPLPKLATTTLVLWFAAPLLLLFLSKLTIYGNIRHLIFLLPPLFILAGLAAAAILRPLRHLWARNLLILAILLPGIIADMRLHPYEYVYYNALAGGLPGADGQFEIDRWCLSTREALEFVNHVAPENALVTFPRHPEKFIEFARPDLQLTSDLPPDSDADYVVYCTYRNKSPWNPDGYLNIYNVARENVVLSSVWARK